MYTWKLTMDSYKKWEEGWEEDDGTILKTDPEIYKMIKKVLDQYWLVQKIENYFLPYVSMDIIKGETMFIDFRNDNNVVSCICEKDKYTVTCRKPCLEKELKDPREVAILLDNWIHKYLFKKI